MLKISAIPLVLGLLLFSASCRKKDALAGIDKNALFAAPSQNELDAVQAAWAQRDLIPQEVSIEETHVINDKLNYHLISFRLNGLKQYAGALVPVTSSPLPVHLFVYGFALNDPVSIQNIGTSNSGTLPFVYVIPALSGQSLAVKINGTEYKSPQSEGTRNNAFDGATDDAIACLNAVAATFSEADGSKAIIRGGSRGGTVALLAAIRDTRIKLAAGVAFPSDLIELTASHQNDDTYKFQFLDALINKTATLEETRLKMIASSPLYFCKNLPKTQIHFGAKDVITPARQGEKLLNAMKALGLEDHLELFIYPNYSHEMGNNPEMEARIKTFFSQL
ncbi:alpha/beta hydrolase family protein [Chitinophaga sp. GCM10012297]|uniref:Prolyl oligopeptidase family serine peptidase n=1 Tax=Chitinophaga chungangae TaxID=2821488 RepID=A0ABS3YDR7_9BACT|nr:prolyl oligopeptidase family serine peptidase [Chitinophaga chungangae]MBO9152822.1 prolyl oligopeptidase family serine peptidase [Chitinophaga chungangae]